MFTGIVEEVGSVTQLEGYRMSVAADLVMGGMKLGDSMAVNGACLTVVEMGAKEFSVDLSPETLRRTSLGDLAAQRCTTLEEN